MLYPRFWVFTSVYFVQLFLVFISASCSQPKNKNEIELEKTIENTLSKCDNITPDAAKKMLLKLVRNEHVMALVRKTNKFLKF